MRATILQFIKFFFFVTSDPSPASWIAEIRIHRSPTPHIGDNKKQPNTNSHMGICMSCGSQDLPDTGWNRKTPSSSPGVTVRHNTPAQQQRTTPNLLPPLPRWEVDVDGEVSSVGRSRADTWGLYVDSSFDDASTTFHPAGVYVDGRQIHGKQDITDGVMLAVLCCCDPLETLQWHGWLSQKGYRVITVVSVSEILHVVTVFPSVNLVASDAETISQERDRWDVVHILAGVEGYLVVGLGAPGLQLSPTVDGRESDTRWPHCEMIIPTVEQQRSGQEPVLTSSGVGRSQTVYLNI
jgi:hypothetical protein